VDGFGVGSRGVNGLFGAGVAESEGEHGHGESLVPARRAPSRARLQGLDGGHGPMNHDDTPDHDHGEGGHSTQHHWDGDANEHGVRWAWPAWDGSDFAID